MQRTASAVGVGGGCLDTTTASAHARFDTHQHSPMLAGYPQTEHHKCHFSTRLEGSVSTVSQVHRRVENSSWYTLGVRVLPLRVDGITVRRVSLWSLPVPDKLCLVPIAGSYSAGC